MCGILDAVIEETPIAIFDFETTGLTPGQDRVVEISVMRKEPNQQPRLVFDSLVNPRRKVAATEIHGISDDDVKDAPFFEEIAGNFLEAISECVVAAYNVYFDIRFLTYEFCRVGAPIEPPHFCLMYMRPMLDLGARCRLAEACSSYAVKYEQSHVSASDAEASASLFEKYLGVMKARSLRTFGDLARLRSYKFTESFRNDPASHKKYALSSCNRVRSRRVSCEAPRADPGVLAIRQYWDLLKTVVADLEISECEVDQVAQLRQRLQLPDEQVRVLHARAFSNAISQFVDDLAIDDREVIKLRRLKESLHRLGWAPGD